MIMTSRSSCRLLSATLLSLALSTAHAQSTPEELRLRATILILVESLVDSGVLTRAKADELVRTASFGPASPSAGTPAGGVASAAAGAVAGSTVTAAEIGPDGKRVVRVPYVPESLKREMREQIRQDVLAQAKTERWGNPGALPDWLSRCL